MKQEKQYEWSKKGMNGLPICDDLCTIKRGG
jgi:hypothetical protein